MDETGLLEGTHVGAGELPHLARCTPLRDLRAEIPISRTQRTSLHDELDRTGNVQRSVHEFHRNGRQIPALHLGRTPMSNRFGVCVRCNHRWSTAPFRRTTKDTANGTAQYAVWGKAISDHF